MNCDNCSNLDAYLSSDLPAEEASRFVAHLDQCEACRDAIDQQRWIDGLLTSPICRELESPPGRLIDSISTTNVPRRRPTRLIACVIATAAALAVAAGWIVLNRQASDRAPHGDVAAVKGDVAELVRATFIGGSDVLVVPVASRHPNVTIVRIYPAYQPTYDAQANSEPFSLDHFNGG